MNKWRLPNEYDVEEPKYEISGRTAVASHLHSSRSSQMSSGLHLHDADNFLIQHKHRNNENDCAFKPKSFPTSAFNENIINSDYGTPPNITVNNYHIPDSNPPCSRLPFRNLENFEHTADFRPLSHFSIPGLPENHNYSQFCTPNSEIKYGYVSSPQENMTPVHLLKKLGASEYEGRQLKKKLSDLEEALQKKEEKIIEMEKELSLQADKWKDVESDKKFAEERLNNMELYFHKLPAPNEVEDMMSKINHLREENRQLMDKNETLNETVSTYKKKLKSKDEEVLNCTSRAEQVEKEFNDFMDESKQYKAKIKDLFFSNYKVDFEKTLNDLEKYKESSLSLRKLLKAKQVAIDNMQSKAQSSIENLQQQLDEKRKSLTSLSSEITLREGVISKLMTKIKELQTANELLEAGNKSLKLKVSNAEKSINEIESNDDTKQKLQVQLLICFEELSALVNVFKQSFEGKDPDLSLIIGTKGLSDKDLLSIISNKSSNQRLNEVIELRKGISSMHDKFCDNYVKNIGENCIMQ